LNNAYLKGLIRGALDEDIPQGDLTASFFGGMFGRIKAHIVAKEEGVLCGVGIAGMVFKTRDRRVLYRPLQSDGMVVKKNERVADIRGGAEPIVAAERTALNFLMQLSGIATLTAAFVARIKGSNARIMDTRKNHPFLREIEKYAVRMGGGYNHRPNLSGGVLIKENYLKGTQLKRAQKVDTAALRRVFDAMKRRQQRIIIEVESLDEFRAVAALRPEVIILDNLTVPMIKKAVAVRSEFFPQVQLEVSGGVDLKNVRQIARTDVDYISIGSLTHSYRSLDFSLEIE